MDLMLKHDASKMQYKSIQYSNIWNHLEGKIGKEPKEVRRKDCHLESRHAVATLVQGSSCNEKPGVHLTYLFVPEAQGVTSEKLAICAEMQNTCNILALSE